MARPKKEVAIVENELDDYIPGPNIQTSTPIPDFTKDCSILETELIQKGQEHLIELYTFIRQSNLPIEKLMGKCSLSKQQILEIQK